MNMNEVRMRAIERRRNKRNNEVYEKFKKIIYQ